MSRQHRKRPKLFYIDAVCEEQRSPNQCHGAEFITSTVSSMDIMELQRSAASNNHFLALLALKVGFVQLEEILQICQVIPPESGPWRKELATELLQQTCTCAHTTTSLLDTLRALLLLPVSSLPQQQQYPYPDVLSRVLQHGDKCQQPFAGCLAPPTATCLECSCPLQQHNRPCYITLYTAHGPMPLKKVELRCQHQLWYY